MNRAHRGWIVAALVVIVGIAIALNANLSLANQSETLPSSQSASELPVPPSQAPTPSGPPDGWETALVSKVIDGDTVKLSDGRKVRLIGIDTPERGQCGFGPAASNMRRLVAGKNVRLSTGASSDMDKYGRILRYLEIDGSDAGRDQIGRGLATARYDSRDGYGPHARERDYVALDATTPDPSCVPKPRRSATAGATTQPPIAPSAAAATGTEGIYYSSCSAARRAGAAPLRRGTPGYRVELDRDRNGVACQ